MRTWVTAVSLAVALLSCADAPRAASSAGLAPWTVEVPGGWHETTMRTPASDRLKTGVLRTYVANVPLPFTFSQPHPGPNAGAGASGVLGPGAVVVFVQYLWSPPEEPIAWPPATEIGLGNGWVDRWHADAQNRGWRFRERRVCHREACVAALEWHGPAATVDDLALAREIVDSIDLLEGWVDPAGLAG